MESDMTKEWVAASKADTAKVLKSIESGEGVPTGFAWNPYAEESVMVEKEVPTSKVKDDKHDNAPA